MRTQVIGLESSEGIGKTSGKPYAVGNAANGKMLRVYEKGRQMGDSSSDWVRFEVQLGNRDRVRLRR